MAQRYKVRLGDGTFLTVDLEGLRAWVGDRRAVVQAVGSQQWRPLADVLAEEEQQARLLRALIQPQPRTPKPAPVVVPAPAPPPPPPPRPRHPRPLRRRARGRHPRRARPGSPPLPARPGSRQRPLPPGSPRHRPPPRHGNLPRHPRSRPGSRRQRPRPRHGSRRPRLRARLSATPSSASPLDSTSARPSTRPRPSRGRTSRCWPTSRPREAVRRRPLPTTRCRSSR
jgi:hypothetical protein